MWIPVHLRPVAQTPCVVRCRVKGSAPVYLSLWVYHPTWPVWIRNVLIPVPVPVDAVLSAAWSTTILSVPACPTTQEIHSLDVSKSSNHLNLIKSHRILVAHRLVARMPSAVLQVKPPLVLVCRTSWALHLTVSPNV